MAPALTTEDKDYMREALRLMIEELNARLPMSTEKIAAITRLTEARMWLDAAPTSFVAMD